MKIYTQIPAIFPSDIGEDLYHRLCDIYPDGRQVKRGWEGGVVDSFWCFLPSDDPRVEQIIGAFRDAGFHPWTDRTRDERPDEYMLNLIRKYDHKDYEAAEYLEPSPEVYVEGMRMTKDGALRITKKTVRPGILLATAGAGDDVVSSRFLESIRSASLLHVLTRPTELYDDQAVIDDKWSPHVVPWPDPAEALLELTSDFILPPLSPSMRIEYEDGTKFDGDFERRYVIREGLYRTPELHYLASSLEGLEPFDLACSFEWWGTEFSRRTIASKRFYQFCVDQGVETEWVPVRIDPG